ncbi:MAG: glycosyltransferase family 39 protein [Chloroflexota bacterium]
MVTVPVQAEAYLRRKSFFGLTPAILILAAIMLLSAGLHFHNLSSIGDANTYYTAAVESMLQSWSNFFFAAAEPGGSVTVDKPPLGLWVEAAFAFVLGVEGWVVSLPNILAGIVSVPLLFGLVKKYMGDLAGLVAALALVVTPVAIATDRNNTADGMLVFTLLLAAWAFIQATETGRARWLFLGAILVGLGFNIKMLQAFLPLPAFYALYFLGAKTGWFRKIIQLGAATIILLVVSLTWAVIVDLTPADQRPYIGSSDDNTVMELIVGHNGLSRLFNPRSGGDGRTPGDPPVGGAPPQRDQLTAGGPPNRRPPASPRPGIDPSPGAPGGGPGASPNMEPVPPQGAGSTPFSQETGSPSLGRFFTSPLSKQASWLLPFGLVAIVLAVFAARLRLPLEREHKALVLWGGWLLTCLVFFSAVEGIFHAYYVIMLAPALAAVVGAGIAQLWRWQARIPWMNLVLVCSAAATVTFQVFSAFQYGVTAAWLYLSVVLLFGGIGLLCIRSLRPAAYLTIIASLVLIPLAWTASTVLESTPEVNLPTAFDGGRQVPAVPVLNEPNQADEALLAYLQANTQDVEYLVAVPNAHTGSALVLATGRPVLYMGGFSGNDPVVDAADLAAMVAEGKLRFILYGGERGGDRVITDWLTATCRAVPRFNQSGSQSQPRPQPDPIPPGGPQSPPGGGMTLYRCGG